MASAGWDAEAVAGVRVGVKRLFGRLAYLLSAFEALIKKPSQKLSIELADGRRHTGFGVIAGNCRYYGGRYVVTPEASLLKPSLDICLLKQGGRVALVKFALSLFFKKPLTQPLVDFLEVTQVRLTGGEVAVQVDGDDWGRLPVTIEAVPAAVSVVLPEDYEH
jgi:diacylglycerol kinase family enzyme